MICSKCEADKPSVEFYTAKLNKQRECKTSWCKTCFKKATRLKTATSREQIIKLLGGKCKHCGFTDKRALQVDHINGGGMTERRLIGSHGMYRKVLKCSDGYQLLCANCNWIKRYENNENPNKGIN